MNELIDLNEERYKRYIELDRIIKRNDYRLTMYDKSRELLRKSLKMNLSEEEDLYVNSMIEILSHFILKGKEEELTLKTERTRLENTLKNLVYDYITEEIK